MSFTTENKRPSNVQPNDAAAAAKRTKMDSSNATLRDWSASIDSNNSNSTIYTLKCYFGDPNEPLASHLKSAKVAILRGFLEERGVSSKGTKKELLERIQKDVPYIIIEIDSRECLQRVVNATLHYFQWDNTHLFECKMTRRGDLTEGTEKFCYAFGLDMGWLIQEGKVSPNPEDHTDQYRRHYERTMKAAGLWWDNLARAVETPNALGPYRKLGGAGFIPFLKNGRNGRERLMEDEFPQGGHFSLEQLALEPRDKISVKYDFGSQQTFTIQVTSVDSHKSVLPEVDLGHENATRVKLAENGNGKPRSQYQY